jgi:hypothetical protein
MLPRAAPDRDRGRGVVVEVRSPVIDLEAAGVVEPKAGTATVDVGRDVVEGGSNPLLTLSALSSRRTGPLPAEHIEATGVKRRKYGNAGRIVKLRSNHVEVKLDQKMLYHYDGMYVLYSWEDK